jgi:hypothetical protein
MVTAPLENTILCGYRGEERGIDVTADAYIKIISHQSRIAPHYSDFYLPFINRGEGGWLRPLRSKIVPCEFSMSLPRLRLYSGRDESCRGVFGAEP